MFSATTTKALFSGLALSAAASASAQIDWLSYAPTPIGSSFPSGSVFNLTGVGPVTVTYSANASLTDARSDQFGFFDNGNVGPDTWTAYEAFGRTNIAPAPPLNVSWDVTYTFTSVIPAQSLVVGVNGLGRRDDPIGGTPGAVSTATVVQNGTYLGEFFGVGGPWGSNLFTSGPGVFTLENSVTGVGGANPHWNTALAVVRIDDAVSSITVRVINTAGDGLAVNIGVLVPTPGTVALAGMGMLPLAARRRRG